MRGGGPELTLPQLAMAGMFDGGDGAGTSFGDLPRAGSSPQGVPSPRQSPGKSPQALATLHAVAQASSLFTMALEPARGFGHSSSARRRRNQSTTLDIRWRTSTIPVSRLSNGTNARY